MKDPALGMLEFKSVARGIFATDAIIKKAKVQILDTHPVCPGKYAVIFAGEVANVEEGLKAGIEAAGDGLINELFLANLHQSIIPAIKGACEIENFGAIGIIETFSIITCVIAADIAAKAANVELVEIRLANGLGGKGYFLMTGALHDVKESFLKAKAYASQDGLLAGGEVIASPHPELLDKGVYW